MTIFFIIMDFYINISLHYANLCSCYVFIYVVYITLVTGLQEVVEEVELASSWDSITSSSSGGSLGQDSGIESDANPDVFFAFVDDTVSPMTLLTSVPSQERGGEVIVQNMYEMKEDDFVLPQDELIVDKEGLINKLKMSQHQLVKVVIKDEMDKELSENEIESYKEEEMGSFKEESIFEEDEFLLDIKTCSSDEGSKALHIRNEAPKEKETQDQLMYHCTECNTNFNSHKNFKAHMEEHLIRLQNSCALCNMEFDSKSELQDHIKDHFAKISGTLCEICKEEFNSKALLKRHKRQMHSSNGHITTQSLKCDVCNAVFSSKFSLKSHSATHSTRKPYTCKECGATFTQNGSLQVHLRRHRGEKPFKCITCGNNFTRAHSLKVHMKTHTGEKPYACEYCGACFVTSSHLTVHRRTHTGERPYSCNSCGATFITTSHLNVHRRLHNSNSNLNASKNSCTKSLSCSFCGITFDDPGKLRHHRRIEHKGMQRANGSVSKCKVREKKHGFPQIRTFTSTSINITDECG